MEVMDWDEGGKDSSNNLNRSEGDGSMDSSSPPSSSRLKGDGVVAQDNMGGGAGSSVCDG